MLAKLSGIFAMDIRTSEMPKYNGGASKRFHKPVKSPHWYSRRKHKRRNANRARNRMRAVTH